MGALQEGFQISSIQGRENSQTLCTSHKIYLASCFAVFETLVRNVRLRNIIIALRILLSI